MPPLGGYGWLKGETTPTDPNDAVRGRQDAAGGRGGGVKLRTYRAGWGGGANKGLFETVLTYVCLAAYLAMPLSIISCYLGEVLQAPLSRELSERASNPPSNNTTTTAAAAVATTVALLDVAQPRVALALRRRPRPRTYITRHRDKTRMDRYTARSMINNYSRAFIRCETTVELPR